MTSYLFIVQAVSEIFGTERIKAWKLAQIFLILCQNILEGVPKKNLFQNLIY